ncbi:hypothetical protein, partial [Prevotella sp. HCN-7019]|uniref:hypothetical protein n=1 Tax=Prevotella sp. HCN-7019 TaxID=3134668 RepID=UPI0030BFE1D9
VIFNFGHRTGHPFISNATRLYLAFVQCGFQPFQKLRTSRMSFLSSGSQPIVFCNQIAIFACASCGEVVEII